MQTPHTLDAATLRRLAVLAHCDPRTIARALRGDDVRGDAGHRAREVLARHFGRPMGERSGAMAGYRIGDH